ncbi:MAG TPA: hypothetical protein VNV42_06000 [Solirubrobacteraceae bacterium]|jgi:hypothetical protein|nr:hypothetical protein [Solirubrobacteraceae bacterium]
MTDTFANGPGAPGGDPNAAPQAGDLTGTLAELERKLRELESELSSIGRRGESADVTSASSLPGMPPAGRLVDEAIEPPAPPAPRRDTSGQPMKFVRPSAPPRRQAPPPQAQPPTPQPPAAEPLAPEPPAPEPPAPVPPAPEPSVPVPPAPEPSAFGPPAARLSAAEPPERRRPTEAQLASLAELRRFRDRLERFARDLTAEYDALLGRVMSGLTSPATADDSTPVAAPAEPQPAVPGPEDALFEGRVELGVGPFYDMAALTAFERQLAALAFVSDASVRRFEASHAVVDVRLATPVALVRELRRALDSEFSVREIAGGRVLLTFDEV